MAKEFLSQRGIEYVEYDVIADSSAEEEMITISGVRSVPVIATCNQVVVGFDRQRLEQLINCLKQLADLPPTAGLQ
jgi:glutaredoxin 3